MMPRWMTTIGFLKPRRRISTATASTTWSSTFWKERRPDRARISTAMGDLLSGFRSGAKPFRAAQTHAWYSATTSEVQAAGPISRAACGRSGPRVDLAAAVDDFFEQFDHVQRPAAARAVL